MPNVTGPLAANATDAKPAPSAAEATVIAAFRAILRRQPEPAGLANSVRSLESGASDLAGLLDRLLRSREFAEGLQKFVLHYVTPDRVRFTNDVSQNGETWTLMREMINRAARHRIVVDAGARGRIRSNSYDLLRHCGWKGLLIEANPRLAEPLRAEFAGLDMTLVSCAISDAAGEATFFVGANPDVSSLTGHKTAGWGEVREQVTVAVRPLSAVLAEHAIPRDFDVLSLDIEGEDFKAFNEVVAAGYRPGWVFLEASRAPETDPLAGLPLSAEARGAYEVAGRTKVNLLLHLRE